MNSSTLLRLSHAVEKHGAGHKGQRIVYNTNPYKKVQGTLKLIGMKRLKSKHVYIDMERVYGNISNSASDILLPPMRSTRLQKCGVWPGRSMPDREIRNTQSRKITTSATIRRLASDNWNSVRDIALAAIRFAASYYATSSLRRVLMICSIRRTLSMRSRLRIV